MKKHTLCLIALFATAPVWAINKCTSPEGKISFQDAPCQGVGKAETIQVRPQGTLSAPRPAPMSLQQPAPQPAPIVAPAPAPAPVAAAPAKSPLEIEAEQCLDWYRPLLRDPAGAYYRSPSKDLNVVSIIVHATNGFGGYVTKPAACEIINGKLDDGWTKIHAKRAGWSVQ